MVFQAQLRSIFGGIALWCMPLLTLGQQSSPPHTVRASAEATVTAKPDQAQIAILVSTLGATAEAASQQNAASTTQLIAALKRLIAAKGVLATSGYFTSPQMQYPKNGGNPKITGYNARNRVTITVYDLELVSKVLDTGIAQGATQVQGVDFLLKDDTSVRTQAIEQASRKAYEGAEAIARALKLTVNGVFNAETVLEPQPVYVGSVAQAVQVQGAFTPIEPADVKVGVTVTVTLEVK